MAALYLIEYAVIAVVIYGVISQIIIPLWRNTPMFPWFGKEPDLRSDHRVARQGVVEEKIRRDIFRTKEEKKKVKASTKRKKGW